MYNAEVLNPSNNSKKRNDKKVYVNSTQSPFKQRYYDHKSSFTHEIYRLKTSLSNYVWEVKNKLGIDPILKWEIMKRCRRYKGVDRYCKLCMEEKLTIATYNKLRKCLTKGLKYLQTGKIG